MQKNELIIPGQYMARPFWLSHIPSRILPESAKTVWCALANHLGEHDEVWPSIEALRLETGFQRERINKDLKLLTQLRLISRRRTGRSSHTELFAPPDLKAAWQNIERVKTGRPPGGSHDYRACLGVVKQHLKMWRKSLLAQGGPDISRMGRKGFLIGSSHMKDDASSLEMETSDAVPVQSSAVAGMTSTDGREMEDGTTPESHSKEPLQNYSINEDRAALGPDEQASPVFSVQACVGSDQKRSAARSSRPKKTERSIGKSEALTNHQKETVCLNLKNMMAYLLYGLPGLDLLPQIDRFEPISVPPSKTNWRQHSTINKQRVVTDFGWDKWQVPTFMGYYWFKVSYYRAQYNKQLTIPQLGRLAGDIRNLMQTMSAEQLYKRINTIVKHWDLICWMNPGSGTTWQLAEDTLSNPKVKSTAVTVEETSEFRLETYYAAMREGRSYFQFTNPPKFGT